MRNDEMGINLIELFHIIIEKAWVILVSGRNKLWQSEGIQKLFAHTTVSGDIYDLFFLVIQWVCPV